MRSDRHRSSARSHSAPVGAAGRPSRYAKVTSSGAISPARAPASIDMLQTVMRPSIESASIAAPVYSSTWPWPPATPSRPIAASTMSFAESPNGSSPSNATCIVFGRACGSVCVASTCSTSEVPMPNGERAERAVRRGVAVAADDRHAGLRHAELRADHVHDPLTPAAGREERHAELLAVRAQRLELSARERVGDRPGRGSARCGPSSRRSDRASAPDGPRRAAPRTPAALVTSCTRCRST